MVIYTLPNVLNSFHTFFFILLCGSYFHYIIFQVTYLFFCLSYSAIDSFQRILNFIYCAVYHCLFALNSSRSFLNVTCIFSILYPRFWIIFTIITLNSFFQVDCLFPLHLFGLVGFYLAPSSAVHFSVFLFCLTYCVWGLLFEGCRFIIPTVFGVCLQWVRLAQWVVQASWWRGPVPVFWLMRLDLVFLAGRITSSGVFWGVCDLIMILGSLSPNGWACVPVLLVVWHRVSSTVVCWSLSGAGSQH